jgi:hypothetical protein
MKFGQFKKCSLLASVGILAAALTVSLSPAFAQKHGGGSGHSSTEHSDSDHGSKGGQRGGRGKGHGGGGGSQSLRDIFHEMESGSTTEHSSATSEEHGSGSASSSRGKRGSASTTRGKPTTAGTKKGSTTAGKKGGKTAPAAAEEEESDRPAWAGTPGRDNKPGRGNVASGTKKGDVYGDMYELLRDENGVPILSEAGFVQPVDKDGNPLPLDAEGNLINPELAIPVELGRLNVGRSPLTVLSTRYEEALDAINAADSVSLDASGRLVLTTDGVTKTIDAPLENLALYVELLNKGTITGVTDPTKFDSSIQYLVDGTMTSADFASAASFLAAASDKTSTLTIDKVVDMNTILGISGSLTDSLGATYVDYSTYSYDRQSVYGDVTVNVLVKQEDGSYLPTTVNVYDTLFNSTEYTGSNVAGFTQAADDALKVISYVHDNAIPESE